MKFGFPIAVLLVACSCIAFASSHSQRERGAAVFQANGCQHCHKMNGVGGHKGPDLSDIGKRMPKSAMREQILHGSKVMPAFADMLTAGQIKDLVAYLHSCRKAPAPEAPTPNTQ